MKTLFKSLRSRIIILALLIGILPMVILNYTLSNSYKTNLINRRVIELKERGNVIATELGRFDNIRDAMTSDMTNILNWYSEAYGGRLLIIAPDYRIIMDTYSAETSRFCISNDVFAAFDGVEMHSYSEEAQFIDFVIPVFLNTAEGSENLNTVTGALIFSSTTSWLNESLRKTRIVVSLFCTLFVVIVILIAVYASYVIVRPVNRFRYALQKYEGGDTTTDITDMQVYTEIDGARDSFAHVIRNYQELEKSQNEFISNVSHELKTPMTSIRVLSDSLLGQTNVDEAVYQEFLGDISVEVDRESRIIEDLLAMSRLQKASDSINAATTNINDFVLDILRRLRPIAKEREIELVYESFRTVTADVDEMKLSQAFTNLIENGIKYNNDGGTVKVSLDADHEYFYLQVKDNGVGIPEDALEHIFDRFYRVDKARSRETGGTGLGLYITKTIILLHYGIIKAESTLGEGTTFTVRIPLKHIRPKGGNTV